MLALLQATGLALPGSDLDIVVLGVGATLARAGTGFTKVQRKQQSELLEDLLDVLVKVGGWVAGWLGGGVGERAGGWVGG